jgi:hypothetical protein
MQSIVMLSVSYAECYTQALYTKCPNAKYHYAEFRYTECLGAFKPTVRVEPQ